jgi:hypothetical protein
VLAIADRPLPAILTAWFRRPCAFFLVAALIACGEASPGIPLLPQTDVPASAVHKDAGPAGRLAVLSENPRYFADAADRRAVYLTGSHTWNNFQDWGPTDPPRPFDYTGYLDFLERHGHNFIRLYVWEQAAWFPGTDKKVFISPLPYLRTGPGIALDGGLRFDLGQFNPSYFHRLRERVQAAGRRGIYVSVMLFDGWSVELKGEKTGNPWRGHPFNRENNINGINGDLNGDGEGKEVHTLMNSAVTALQKSYLRKIVETLSDLDNVLWEVSNESHSESGEWQYEMIRTIRNLESRRGKRHPVGMTPMWPPAADANAPLFESPADWISPFAGKAQPVYRDNPPAATGRKVLLSDTDHLWGIGGTPRWVWEAFMRGMNPIFMDPYTTAIRNNLPAWPSAESGLDTPAPEWDAVRKAMGYSRALARRVDLASMRPIGELASSGYCLAAPGKEYLIYVPSNGGWLGRLMRSILRDSNRERVVADLSATPGALDVEWVDVERGEIIAGEPVRGGRSFEFRAPFSGDAVLHLTARDPGNPGRKKRPGEKPGNRAQAG